MVVLQSMWKGPNHCWNFMESRSESATYVLSKPLRYKRLKLLSSMWLKSGREKDSVGYLVLFFSSSTMSCSLSSLLSLLTDSTLSPRASARAASVYPRPLVRTILALKYETEPYQWQPELTGYESFIAEK